MTEVEFSSETVYRNAKMTFHKTEGQKNFPDRIPCLRCKKFKPDTPWLHPCSKRKNFCLKYGSRMCRAYEVAGMTFEDAERWRRGIEERELVRTYCENCGKPLLSGEDIVHSASGTVSDDGSLEVGDHYYMHAKCPDDDPGSNPGA